MKISHNAFSAHIAKGIQPLYLLFGAETLLIEETLDRIRVCAREQGFTERLRLTIEPGFDWNQLFEHAQTKSMFSSKKIIELRIASGKPGDAGGKALLSYAENLPPDNVLVVVAGAIEKRSQKTKWFMALLNAGVVTECPAIAAEKLPDWIGKRLLSRGLKYNRDAGIKLGHLVEGNLLAAAQEIDLLALLHPKQTITSAIIDHAIADHARFNVYNFADACLSGAVDRSIRILQSLKQEQTEPVLIIWALTRDTRTLCHLADAAERGKPARSMLQKLGVWSSRGNLVTTALKRQRRSQWENILKRLGQADMMVKGGAPLNRRDIWEELESIALMVCGVKIP